MDDEDVPRLDVPHETWWRAPLLTSLIGVPLLVWEIVALEVDGIATEPFEFGICVAVVLFVIAWILPHTRANRGVRMTTAGGGLGCALLPLVLGVLLGVAM